MKQSIECWLINQVNPELQVLLLQVAAQTGRHPAFYQLITGEMDPGETPHEACLREV